MLTFLNYPEIEPVNNRVEITLRNLVLLRKIIFSSRSEQKTYLSLQPLSKLLNSTA
ncbi:MAG: hypothetical protein DRN09_02475 [Thermoplasmata archaeon]|nr:MAG: hypothetical protein DRN09_02475 [Thermoplasmata archaeon]